MSSTLVKQNPAAPKDFFEAEASGLRWLSAAGGARCVRVVDAGPGRIELERISTTQPSREAASAFGRELATTHDAGAAAFGAAPDGWSGRLYIGRREMPSHTADSWGEFYARYRVEPFLDTAVDAGNLSSDERALVDTACGIIASGAFDDGDAPARIHGDLWNGNVLWADSGAVLIDPAAHGGHRETDLAMLSLFGLPYLETVLAGYQERHPLRDGWRERVPVHQLHPLAVHAAGHGRGYGVELATAARAVIALAG
ncbi:Fructosamine-3-kinase [Paramicrobacterium humi]|uniref:Fructosamine-3-kinase n=1 Tax=Paramicrobacterium humi TaxID=640635 RepID=A0A1H4PP74_9MICO|nr:fructosamine kinase family protein [Microbacterium humi]SEC09155.1 Fructosamine-3-kinase [Microbacterium humi]